MDQKAYVDNVDPAENESRETKHARRTSDGTREIHAERPLDSDAMAFSRREMQKKVVLCRCCDRLFPRHPLVL